MICITGGIGYIGSHIALALSKDPRYKDTPLVLLDDLSNTSRDQADRVLDKLPNTGLQRIALDRASPTDLVAWLAAARCTAIIHCAGLKDGPESLGNPLAYFGRNLSSTYVVTEVARRLGVPLVFSSSASVYAPSAHAVEEGDKLGPMTPYAWTKSLSEQVVQSIAWTTSLRYFNPVGSAFSEWGEAWSNTPGSVVHRMCQASTRNSTFIVHGSDYPTADGSPIRDFIDVQDLANAHVAVLKMMEDNPWNTPRVLNVGTGTGCSILQLIAEFHRVTGLEYVHGPRREGDIPVSVANADLIQHRTDWRPVVPLMESLVMALRSYQAVHLTNVAHGATL